VQLLLIMVAAFCVQVSVSLRSHRSLRVLIVVATVATQTASGSFEARLARLISVTPFACSVSNVETDLD
jgi:hypothetical protein